MTLLTSFAPFISFAALVHLGYVKAGLWTGALVAGVLLLRDHFALRHSLKILEVGTLALFCALALYTSATGQEWTIPAVRLVVDSGLLVIVLASIAAGRPFTLQYAREHARQEVYDNPRFVVLNRNISLVWAAAFTVLVLTDAAMVYVAEIPKRLDIIATVLALVGAYKFTARERADRRLL